VPTLKVMRARVVHQFEFRGRPPGKPPCDTPAMADPVCAECGKPILPTADKTTIQDLPYHAAFWTGRATRKA
jgi:hypothetical protein